MPVAFLEVFDNLVSVHCMLAYVYDPYGYVGAMVTHALKVGDKIRPYKSGFNGARALFKSCYMIVTEKCFEVVDHLFENFFANASHELKTPITVMQGFAEVLMNKEGMDDTSQKQLGRIYKECLRLGSLISDMLMLSKIESGDTHLRALSEVALEDIAREVLDGLSEKAQSRNITAKIVGSAKICADPTMIFELVQNLVSNAIKYNKDGGSVTVFITETDTGVSLAVEDTGIGIEKEHLPRLCERFYRVDKSHSKRIGGTGLGLAIVKHICAVLNAKLSIKSEVGLGTTVTVVFDK